MPGNTNDKWFDLFCLLVCGLFISIAYTNCSGFRGHSKVSVASSCATKPGLQASKVCPPPTDLPQAATINWPRVDDLSESLCPSATPSSTGSLTLAMNFGFEKRMVGPGGLAPDPVRLAFGHYLYRVTRNSDGTIQQCGTLPNSGSLTIALPPENYDWEVYSIISKNNNHTVVLQPQGEDFVPYSTAINFDYTGVDVGALTNPSITLTALESENSGAFNILRQIQRVNGFVHPRVGACTTGRCADYNPVDTYAVWDRGRPLSFEGRPSSTHTEVIDIDDKKAIVLAIAGGNTAASEDSDEFDDDVISFTYSRSLIKILGLDKVTNSPGDIMNPTLPHVAADLGITYFLQFHTNNTNSYIDTYGDASTSGGFVINLAFDDPASATWGAPVTLSAAGDGNTRGWQMAKLFYDFTRAGGLSGTLQKNPATFFTNYLNTYHDSTEPLPTFKTTANAMQATVAASERTALNNLISAYFLDRNRDFVATLEEGTGCIHELFTTNAGFLNLSNNKFYTFSHAGGPLDFQIRTVDKRLASLSFVNFYITPLDFSVINSPTERLWESNTYTNLENTRFIRHSFTDLAQGTYMLGVQGNASADVSNTGINFSVESGGKRFCQQ